MKRKIGNMPRINEATDTDLRIIERFQTPFLGVAEGEAIED